MAKRPAKKVTRKRVGLSSRKKTIGNLLEYSLVGPALEAAQIVIAEVDATSGDTRWSSNALTFFGLRKKRVVNFQEFITLISDEDRPHFESDLKALKARGKKFQGDYRITLPQGMRWFHTTASRIASGTLVFSMQDVTSRKTTESELADWRRRHELVTASGGIIIYDYDVRSGNISWSGDLENVVGFTNRQMGRIERWADLIHPEDRDEAYRLLEVAQSKLENYDVYYRFKTLKRGYRYMHDRGMFIGDANGNAIQMLGMMNDVSERMVAEINLKDNEKKFRKLLEDINVGVVLHGADARIRLINKAALAMLGVSEMDLRGRTTFESFFDIIHEDGTPFLDEDLPAIRAVREGKAIRNVVMGLCRPGTSERVWLLANTELTVFPNDEHRCAVVTITDISERKKMEQALKDSELRFRTLQDASFGGIGLHKQGLIIDCNQGLCDITGYSHDELIGRNGVTLIAPEHQELVVHNIRNDYDKPYDVVGIRKDGTRYALEIRGKNIPYKEGTIRVTEFRDISERKLAESKILEQNAKLVAITKDLQIKNDQLHEFAQIVSHNLRSPVGNILSLLSLIDSAENEEEKREYFKLLEESGATTLTTLNELNEVLQIKQNKDIEKQDLEFATVFDHVIRMLNARIAQSDAGIITDFIEAPIIHYPNIYLESIFLNLLSNALKYAHPDRKLLIRIRSFRTEGKVTLTVSDNGLGINMNKYGHQVFKLRKTFHHHPESRGIGLFMIKNQIVSMGGDITVSSIENEGSTFTVTF
jgi:PAS domain S-box-containing protein